jgi:hypothetical protein
MRAVHRWRFGAIDVDASESRLWKDGRVVQLSHRAFAVLVALLRRPGELVTKSELLAAARPGIVVSDAALSGDQELRVALATVRPAALRRAMVHGPVFASSHWSRRTPAVQSPSRDRATADGSHRPRG